MTHINTPSRFIALALVAWLAAGSYATAAVADRASESLEIWSQQLWESALKGNRDALLWSFEHMPQSDLLRNQTTRFQDSLAMYERNRESARQDREEARDKAFSELREHLEAGELSKALRSGVEAQTLSDDMDAALDHPAIRDLIAVAEREIPQFEDDGDWLRAQEVLFRMRTLYEDTNRRDQYDKYDRLLEQVNRRVSLLSRYAPRQLHKLRQGVAERLGEEPLPEFNPALADDWQERVESIDGSMLRQSLRTASRDHIEDEGWRPLLEGGLDALRLLGTTTALKETFPLLDEPDKVQLWTDGIDKEIERFLNKSDRDLDSWSASRLIDRLARLNSQTLDFPEPVLFREFGDGAMHRLDEYSEVIWPENLRRFRQQTEGNFIGVGILIRHNERREIKVVNPLEGSPAYFAGIKPDDVIVEVDNEPTVGWSLNDAVDRITGPEGETVTLGIRRDGETDLLEFAIARERIRLHTVRGWWKEGLTDDGGPKWNWFIDEHSRIAYIKLTNFNEETYNDLHKAWQEIQELGPPNGLILDLRFNPGGLLTSAVRVSNMFLRSGVIVSGENRFGVRAWPDQRASARAAEMAGLPTVVLINKGSASGSEIVAGALQAHGAAVIVGERSYGKGSVQTVHQIAEQAALKLTTQYFRLPPASGEERGRLVHRRPTDDVWGVDPDIVVPMSPHQVTKSIELRQQADILPEELGGGDVEDQEDRPDISKLLTEGIDPQIEMGLLILQARALGKLEEEQRHAARE